MTFAHNEDGVVKMAKHLQEEIISLWIEAYKLKTGEVSTIFLAWAPWAWKTEFIESIAQDAESRYIILDTDKYRCLFEGYTWKNAHEFQQLASRVMDKMYSFCIKNELRVIMDGTFAAKGVKINENINQCIKHNRLFSIVLIHQDPILSYLYTKIREHNSLRNVPKEEFIRKYFDSIENTFDIVSRFPTCNVQVVIKSKYLIEPTIDDTIRDKRSFYEKLQEGLIENEPIDISNPIEYNATDLRESLDAFEAIMDEIRNHPEILDLIDKN